MPLEKYEAAVVPGLEAVASEEILERLRGSSVSRTSREGRLSLLYSGPANELEKLDCCSAVYQVLEVKGARPSAVLGHENFKRLTDTARQVMGRHENGDFTTLRLSAAGSDSKLLQRIKAELARELGLTLTQDAAHLELALRRSGSGQGWEVLLRLTARPLSARAWRVCDYPGALNASVASAMLRLTRPQPDDVLVNLCCGSGTLIVERLRLGRLQAAYGFDINPAAIDCAQRNLSSSRGAALTLAVADATRSPLPDGVATTVAADLPFAMLLGESASNRELYPAILQEAARLLRPGGTLTLITTQNQLMQQILDPEKETWVVTQKLQIKLPFANGYISPTIHVLTKR